MSAGYGRGDGRGTRHSAADYGRVLETATTGGTFTGAVNRPCRDVSRFDYELIVDTAAGQASGRLGDQTFPTIFPVTTQLRPTGRVLIYFSQYGWFTGHYLRVDDLRVEAYD
ncbi:MAG TPA: hypothetical protein PK095_16025 [Myxococcota bacterium]|nr:hypothetical protein [Myxococcota bacterium]